MAGRPSRRKVFVTVAIMASVVLLVAIGFALTDDSNDPNYPQPITKADCELAELPLPEGTEGPVEASAISDSGEYIVGTANGELIRWQNHEPEVLESDVGEVTGVNSSGVVVGVDDTPWVYRDDTMTQLQPAPDDYDNDDALLDNPPAINDAEVIMAAMSIDVEGETLFDRSQLWQPGHVQADSFPFSGAVWDISADGVAVGADDALAGPGSAHMWDVDNDTVARLPIPDGIESVPAYRAANGWAASYDGLLWDLESPATQPQELDLDTVADVDADGAVYGELGAVPALESQSGERHLLPLPKEDSAKTKVLGASSDGSTIVGYSGIGVTAKARVWSCG